MQAGLAQGPRGGLTGAAKRVGWKLDSRQQEVRTEFTEGIERVQVQTRKGGSLFFALGLGFLLRIVVWCMCPLRHPGTG